MNNSQKLVNIKKAISVSNFKPAQILFLRDNNPDLSFKEAKGFVENYDGKSNYYYEPETHFAILRNLYIKRQILKPTQL